MSDDRLERLKDLIAGRPTADGPPDPALQVEADSLRASAAAAPPSFLAAAWEPSPPPPAEPVPSAIGPYRVIGTLGAGGMGVVYRAEQAEPLRREVAVKVLRTGLVSPAGLARFELERAALARLCHPNVAAVIDAGAAGGRPYVVMELADGPTLVEYADRAALPLPDRLRLLAAAARGVAHAHARGVIHRDLKPGNVLVPIQDGKPVPKVIDFGIAKLTDNGPTPGLTATDQLLGTLEYMSPELAAGGAAAADVRSDVYALGAILYELVTGVPPVSGDGFREKGVWYALRQVQEANPPRPSARLVTPPAGHPVARRDVTADLDSVVMYALARDPDRRYQSAPELADDLDRLLTHRPVRAVPPSRWYTLSKFVRRHRVPVALGLAAALSLLTGLTAAVVGLNQAERERERYRQQAEAADRSRQEAETARRDADGERAKAEDALALFNDASFITDARDAETREKLIELGAKLRGLLDSGGGGGRTHFRLELLLGRSYAASGRSEEAARILTRCYEQSQQDWARPIDRFTAAIAVAEYWYQVRNYAESASAAREAVRYADDIGDSRYRVEARFALADALAGQGKLIDAVKLYRESIRSAERDVPRGSMLIARGQSMLGPILAQLDETGEAERVATTGYATYRQLAGLSNPNTLVSGHNLGLVLTVAKKSAAATPVLGEVYAARKVVLGPSHPETLGTGVVLARNHLDLGRLKEAEALYRDAMELGDKAYGNKNPAGRLAAEGLANLHLKQNQPERAVEAAERGVKYAEATYPDGAWNVWLFRLQLATVLVRAGRPKEAIPLATEAHAALAKAVGPDNPHTLRAAMVTSAAYHESGDDERAEEWAKKAQPPKGGNRQGRPAGEVGEQSDQFAAGGREQHHLGHEPRPEVRSQAGGRLRCPLLRSRSYRR